ncbi:MAG: DUF1573 domain-containing protein, partial [Phycisphaerales bacterium]|nr:DUF1573 domain-containing protein [Phycisphaerales bacterium]
FRRLTVISTTLSRLAAALMSLVFVGAASAQLPPPPPETATPVGTLGEIRFESLMHDFGDIWDHEKVTHKFEFSNVGAETLTVTDVRSSCGCTVPELTKKVYAPGESGEVTVIFNPANRSDKQHKVITVTTNSKTTPTARLTITSNVTKVLEIEPPISNMGRIFKNEEKGMKIHVIGSTPDFKAWPAEVQPEDASMFHVEVVEGSESRETDEGKRETVLRVWIDKGLTVGRHAGSLTILTNDKRRPELELRCVVTVIGDLQGRPPRFALGRLEPEQVYESSVRLVNRIAEPFKITKIESTGEIDNLNIDFTPVEEGKFDAYDIAVRGVAPGQSERILGRILVYTDMASEPMVELPIYGFVNAVARPVPQEATGG